MESILAKYDSQLELSSNRILQKIELIKKLNEDQQKSSGLEQINSQSEAVTNEVRSLSNVLNNILSEIHKKNSDSFIGENFLNFIKDFITN
jgi:hypothetical protein